MGRELRVRSGPAAASTPTGGRGELATDAFQVEIENCAAFVGEHDEVAARIARIGRAHEVPRLDEFLDAAQSRGRGHMLDGDAEGETERRWPLR